MNLNELAKEITEVEGLLNEQNITDVKEFLAVLGIRWRDMELSEAMDEFTIIRERAGLLSEHNQEHG